MGMSKRIMMEEMEHKLHHEWCRLCDDCNAVELMSPESYDKLSKEEKEKLEPFQCFFYVKYGSDKNGYYPVEVTELPICSDCWDAKMKSSHT